MAIETQNLTNQKLYFAGEQLVKLKSDEVDNLAYQAQVVNCFSHLYFCYRALVMEIVDQLKVELPIPVFILDGFVEQIGILEEMLAEQDYSCPELMRLKYLAKDADSWLYLLIRRFEQSANGELVEHTRHQAGKHKSKKLHLLEIKGYNESASDFSGFPGELQTIHHELKTLIDEIRDGLVEC